jgi:hypothetical protein
VLPAGYRLLLEAGTRLSFAEDAALVTHAGVVFAGTAQAPIELSAEAGEWRGLLVLARSDDERSAWRHVRVRDTSGVVAGPLALTGGVVFHRGKIVLEDVLLTGTSAEDALNIIHGDIELRRLGIERTRSDAFDGDFVRGSVIDCSFRDIGGDALDVSGAVVTVERCTMEGARDKALSVGEGSKVTAANLHAERVGVGAACKDGSTLDLRASRIVAPLHCGVMSYVKKPEYGPCRTTLTDVAVEGAVPAVKVQHGCTMERDGRTVPSEAIDVEAMYSTIMRK